MTTAIDWDKPGKYPVVLSDALLGKSTNNTYTGIRYNHKPDPSTGASANSAQLKPSSNSDSANYDLSLSDNNDDYTYTGARTSGDGQFILTFDPVRKVLVLDRIDSTFDMNLTSAPWTDDAAQLQSQYEQLEPPTKAIVEESQPKVPQKKATKSKAPAATKAKPAPRAKAEKAQKPKPPPREPTPNQKKIRMMASRLNSPMGRARINNMSTGPQSFRESRAKKLVMKMRMRMQSMMDYMNKTRTLIISNCPVQSTTLEPSAMKKQWIWIWNGI
ncbi:ell-associated factor [Botrytis cinerea]